MDRTSVIVISICVVLLFFTWPKPVEQQTLAPAVETSQLATSAPVLPKESVNSEKKHVVATPEVELKSFDPVTLFSKDKALTVTFDPAKSGIVKTTFANYDAEIPVDGKRSPYVISSEELPLFSLRSGLNAPIITTDATVQDDVLSIVGVLEGTSLKVVRTFWFDAENPYLLKGNISFVNSGDKKFLPGIFYLNAGTIACLDPSKGGYVYKGENNQQVSWKEDGDVEELTLGAIKDKELSDREKSVKTEWVAVENRYFCTALMPQVDFDGLLSESVKLEGDDNFLIAGFGKFSIPTIVAGQTVGFSFDAYIGPKKYDYLVALGKGQEDILDLGWSFIRPLSKIVLKALGMLGGIGYGLAVILITVIIKALFWPITHKSTVSMRKMAEMQPIVKEIKEKYKDNPQMIQQKTMEAYRANKVNPLGGCLPMFVQIPVFFALYSTFRSAVELRHVSFLWCENLAQPDTIGHIFSLAINPLAIIMVVSMLVQQMLTPSTGDPNQKKMMMAMPLVMLIFMYDMPAALTLYWTVNQLISIAQQQYTNRSIKKAKQA